LPKKMPVIDGSGVASIAKNFIYLLSGQGVYLVTRFLYVVIIARVFGPRIYGMISYGIAWYLLFMPLTNMGIAIVLSRDVGKNKQKGDYTATLTLTLRIMSIIVVTAAYIILSLFLESDPASRSMVLVFAFALIGRSLACWTGTVYTAYECNQYSFLQQAIFRSLEVFLGLVVIFIWREALLVVVIHALVWCLEAIYGLIIIHRRVLTLRLNVNFTDISRVFMQGLPLGVSTLLMTLPAQGSLVFSRHMISSGIVFGQLALAMQVFFVLSNIPSALGSVSLPILSRSAVRKDRKDRVYAETILRFSLLLGVLMVMLGMAFGPWLTVLIFGDRYAQAGHLIGPVLCLMIPCVACQALVGVLLAGRQDSQILFGALIGAVFFVITISEALLRYNAVGAIMSATAAMSLTTFYFIFLLRKLIVIDLRFALLKPALAALPAVVVFYALSFAGPVISVLGAFAVMFLICYYFKYLTPQEIIWLKDSFVWIRKNLSFIK
jgi:O-antigen/teichoic acid export membrane protein